LVCSLSPPAEPETLEVPREVRDQLCVLALRLTTVSFPSISESVTDSLHTEWDSIVGQANGILSCFEAHILVINATESAKLIGDLKALLRAFNSITSRADKSRRFWSELRWKAYASIALLTIASFVYVHLASGLDSVSIEELFPKHSHDMSGKSPSTDIDGYPPDLTDYMIEFSKLYFGRPNSFGVRYLVSPHDLDDVVPVNGSDNAPAPPAPPAPMTLKEVNPEAKRTLVTDQRSSMRMATRLTKANESTQDDNVTAAQASDSSPQLSHTEFLKVAMVNSSHLRSTFISSVSCHLMLQKAKQFPWDRLVVTPCLTIAPIDSYGAFTIHNIGIGPAIDVVVQVIARSGLVIKRQYFKRILDDGECHMPVPGEDVSPRDLADVNLEGLFLNPRDEGLKVDYASRAVQMQSTKRFLKEPLYVKLQQSRKLTNADKYFQLGDVWYEVVTSLDRLKEITPIAWNEPCDIKIDYQSLDDKSYSLCYTTDVDSEVVFYRRDLSVLEYDPRTPRPIENVTKQGTYAVRHGVDDLASLFVPFSDPNGTALISCKLKCDISNASVRQPVSDILPVDRFLSPLGQLVVYLKVVGCTTGEYQLDVLVNGIQVQSYNLDLLAPDRFKFPYDADGQDNECKRIKGIFRQAKATVK